MLTVRRFPFSGTRSTSQRYRVVLSSGMPPSLDLLMDTIMEQPNLIDSGKLGRYEPCR